MLKKLSLTLVIAAVVALATASSAEAAVTIKGNGKGSVNHVRISERMAKIRIQLNTARYANIVMSSSYTGNNDANGNTGGTVTVQGGESTTDVLVRNDANYNINSNDDCGCNNVPDVDVTIKGNGKSSHNRVTVRKTKFDVVKQRNRAAIFNLVGVQTATGGNDANGNTGGDVSVSSGNAATTIRVVNNANTNMIGPDY